jgi:D-arabinose 1-dehydrogenase-like Zn-dependent alcohol dehydrogenase
MISSWICDSDDHVLKGTLPMNFPLIPGHEGAGIVESIGDKVSSVKEVGNREAKIFPQQHSKNSSYTEEEILFINILIRNIIFALYYPN